MMTPNTTPNPMPDTPPLPIDAALPALLGALAGSPSVVLQAPPGAGKTTRVPLALLDADWAIGGRVIMLEPRRIAARAAAERMASSLGERTGGTVGYRIRDESRVGPATRIEVVTEGVLTRMLQSDPELAGVCAVLFDEFHERSIHADLGLALCLEAQGALRPALRLLAMSATLDGAATAALMGGPDAPAPIVSAEGRSFAVETRWLERPEKLGPGRRLEHAAADLIERALADCPEGDALAFLPGAREIRDVERLLRPRLDASVAITPLFGDLPFREQRAALAPAPQNARKSGARKLVLATAIAETSLTIDGVRVVIDAGRSRRARFDPASGMGRLVTTRVSKASAEQRRGRAGRTATGMCWRMWTKGEEGGLAERDPPEILEADLAGLALELAEWGVAPDQLRFLDPPPDAAMAEAQALLRALGALDRDNAITAHGRRVLRAPLHPRLAHMALVAGAAPTALRLAALLDDRDPLRGARADLDARLSALRAPERHGAARPALERIATAADRLKRRLRRDADASSEPFSIGALVSLAYPDRIARRRPGDAPRYLLSGGKGARLDETDSLAALDWLAVADLDGDQREARIRLAAPVAPAEIEALHGERIETIEFCEWSERERRVLARRQRRLDALILADEPWRDPPPESISAALLDGLRRHGLDALPWTNAARRLRARLALAQGEAPNLPEVSDAALLDDLETWLGPASAGMRSLADLQKLDLAALLIARLDWARRQRLDALCPPHFTAPTGTRATIDYDADPPRVAIRLQELFGLDDHPVVAGRRITLELLSPAQRPIATTPDLPGFWRGSYAEIAREMRGRYPKHPWPDDPIAATATRSAKKRAPKK